jgi:hypothetical protein
MAVDRWVPHRFANLSDRLVRQNGIILMGLAAFAILWGTGGRVGLLVVLYSINVFITFSLSQLSMCRHWWQERRAGRDWGHGFSINALGLALTSGILVMTTVIKFSQGGWVTLVLTGAIIGLCLAIRAHYNGTREDLRRLDSLLDLPLPTASGDALLTPDPEGSTAVLLVNGYGGLGVHAIFSIRKLFRDNGFTNLVFVQVGRIDAARFKGSHELDELRVHVSEDLQRWQDLARRMGYRSEGIACYGIDVPAELDRACTALAERYVEPVFFSAKLVFAKETFSNRFLHNQTSLEIQRRLLFRGLNTVVLPIRVL